MSTSLLRDLGLAGKHVTIDSHKRASVAVRALRDPTGAVIHSDRGAQFRSAGALTG
ncbi:hypothetical protein FHX82_001478 [Amycolatopsis bartoniae]|nr:hypothetical protein [Amycolatopsis bartoniae]